MVGFSMALLADWEELELLEELDDVSFSSSIYFISRSCFIVSGS